MDLKNAVAISYAQENPKYIEKVMGFVDLLRREYGYNAVMDQMLKQEQTAIDFNEMMSKLIADSEKVIVVLSHTYKKKADAFESGVKDNRRKFSMPPSMCRKMGIEYKPGYELWPKYVPLTKAINNSIKILNMLYYTCCIDFILI